MHGAMIKIISQSSLTVPIGWSIHKPHFVNKVLTEFVMLDLIKTEGTVQHTKHMGVTDFMQHSPFKTQALKKTRY